MKKIITALFAVTFIFTLTAQAQHIHKHSIKGTVYGINEKGKKEALPSSSIFWANTTAGKTTNDKGEFTIEIPIGEKDPKLVASYLGFENDTLTIVQGTEEVEFILTEGIMLGTAVVRARQQGSYISKLSSLKTEIITATGLQKMACCNLAESFENSATVTVGFTDAVSGAKQIQMLGLSGIYTQMLDENIPTLRGLASTYGWSYTPGPWMEAIQVSKGTSSVINGYESTTGQINLEFKKPNNTEPLFINLFGSSENRMEGNLTAATKVSERLSTGLLLHASTDPSEHDSDHDGFMDMPKTKLFNVYNRWIYENPEKQIESRTGFKFLYETRDGGQIKSIPNRYSTNIENKNFNVYNKTGFAIGKREGSTIGIINSFTHHQQNSNFGLKSYEGKQNSYYANVLLSSFIGNTMHKYTVGASFAYDQYDDWYADGLNNTARTDMYRQEIVPGVFAQYNYTYLEKLSIILGVRADHNSRYGNLITPRANLKYSITDNVVFRVSGGRGYRAPNVIAENIGLMASSRKFNIASIKDLDIEKAWNYGANFTFYIPIDIDRKATIGIDYYRTDFDNQAIIDMEHNRHEVSFYNLKGKSYANAWQIDANVSPLRGFEVYTAFRINDTKITYSQGGIEQKVDKPLASQYRGLLNLSYATNFEKWKFDVTAQVNGPSRLPNLPDSNGYININEKSPVFPLYFGQITKKMKRLDIYAGCENIFNYKQDHPIIDPQNPFGDKFDSSRIWGPLMGRKFYAGLRLRIGEIK